MTSKLKKTNIVVIRSFLKIVLRMADITALYGEVTKNTMNYQAVI